MDLGSIQKKYKILVIDTETSNVAIFKSDRLVSEFLINTYDINLSHMYIRRHLHKENYILNDNILIKKLW